MQDIITVTLNPAIDKSTSAEKVLPEKKLRCAVPVFEPGGGGVNVARAIKKLGGDATALYLAGGYTGKFFNQLLDAEAVISSIVETGSHTRENLIVLDRTANQQYRFGMPGPVIREEEWKALLAKIELLESPAYIVCSGSVPQGVPPDIFAMIGKIAARKKARFILDTSGEPLRRGIENGAYLLKPNLGELAALTGKEWIPDAAIESTAKEILANTACEIIVVSMGGNGALLVSRNEVCRIILPEVRKISTVGAGDSMVAGIVWSLASGKELKTAVQYGVACGTAATLNPGTALCKKEDADYLFPLCRVIRS